MENTKQVFGSSSSFTTDLFGPKQHSCSPSSGLFGTILGPSSTGLGREPSNSRITGSAPYDGNPRHRYPDDVSQMKIGNSGNKQSKDRNVIYTNGTAEPSYLSSSIYYGGQEVYSPHNPTNSSHHNFKKNGGDDDANGNNSNSAARGNWWQGSLYY